ncbi:MAG: asparaginase domain-containing protein [Halofilum sp. (in: g-proteobacteria)]|nr:asparaginase domain-containing protein [Halofilum sp. (in: g-proteobacteria)]
MSADKRIAVLSLGGTIAMLRADDGGVVPSLSGQALVDAVPELGEVATIEAESFRQVPGVQLSLDDLCALAVHVRERIEAGVDGVVVTQGTDTLEETSFLLDLLHGSDAPVVFTGAMRARQSPGADGPGNLLAAVQTAAADGARGLGSLLVMHDEIHAARFVQKTHVSLPAAFRSYPGPVGWVAEGGPGSRPDRRAPRCTRSRWRRAAARASPC